MPFPRFIRIVESEAFVGETDNPWRDEHRDQQTEPKKEDGQNHRPPPFPRSSRRQMERQYVRRPLTPIEDISR
jgi:hypothetical protein